ncbi:hypothetical protein [Sphingobacterium sp. UBA7249]|uniref:hypothetical protein n=1 Tax=Sphingobacterium sp. UBA7249 TaxID=1947516 RepID=UPI0025CDFABE|nr:hypothetical protein [Sphingobacterium sp. UBA7249]
MSFYIDPLIVKVTAELVLLCNYEGLSCDEITLKRKLSKLLSDQLWTWKAQ